MKCPKCHEEILHPNPTLCPYCYTRLSFSGERAISNEEALKQEIEEIEKLKTAGRYEVAAQAYEGLEMWDKAGECRRMARANYVVSANVNIGKVGTISMECPYCGASQPIASKSNEVTCKYCGKNYVIPKKVLDLL
jgi:ribosomal protein S27E